MVIKNLKLQNFRNISEREFVFSEGITVISGKNALGKTNTLEAIYLTSAGKSFRVLREDEMIQIGEGLARVASQVTSVENLNLEVVLVSNTESARGGKKLLVNGVSRRLLDYVGNLKVVMFGPWDLGIVTESPSTRRRFLDAVLSQTDREYRRSLLSYEKGIRQRNRVLERIREGEANRSQLLFWDHLLIKEGEYITSARGRLTAFVNSTPSFGEELFLEYDSSVISPGRLADYEREEVLSATTLVGPHRDDVIFRKKKEKKTGWDLARFGSRGEQRMAVLWAKIAELEFVEKESGERPVLLLDDIFSELDPEHHKLVIETAQKQQTVLTTAEPRSVDQFSGLQFIAL